MFEGLHFQNLEVMDMVLIPGKGIFIYAKFSDFFVHYQFFINSEGRVFGRSGKTWLELSEDGSLHIKSLVERYFNSVPVYIESS